ncbi:hypothetical protein BDR26DRAFT_860366 [Obelidium mucronatum]|nr:hypothetical protein BDR26DRAFT_860366 [Obelidium mucronatum]
MQSDAKSWNDSDTSSIYFDSNTPDAVSTGKVVTAGEHWEAPAPLTYQQTRSRRLIPPEIVQEIFSHISPTKVLKFKRVCKWIHECLSQTSFILLVIPRFPFSTEQERVSALWFWLHLPEIYQKAVLAHFGRGFRGLNAIQLNDEGDGTSVQSFLLSLSGLKTLDLTSYRLSGDIMPLFQLENLECLRLPPSRRLTGFIPHSIGKLTHLTVLILDYNRITGWIPPEIGNLELLTILSLSNNNLTGEIPRTIGSLKNLRQLDLQNNALQGPVPGAIAQCGHLKSLRLCGNPLMNRRVPKEISPGSPLADLIRLSFFD